MLDGAKAKARFRKYRATNKGQETHRLSQRRYTLKHKFGLTVEQYDALLSSQKSQCAICLKVPVGLDRYRKAKALAVDHNHQTGKVRGLLCDLCNRGIGQLQDEIEIVKRAVAYLEAHNNGN